jgi:hypothetical protein
LDEQNEPPHYLIGLVLQAQHVDLIVKVADFEARRARLTWMETNDDESGGARGRTRHGDM